MAVTAMILGLLTAAAALPAGAGSARMALDLAPGIVAEADYWPGEVSRPAVLVLHGFLQTGDFSTVRRLAESLAGEGFSVLLPSLSLGLSRRQQSLACEAIHLHSMQQDVAELRAWSEWLIDRAGKPPVLIGHSAAGAQLAALLDANRDLPVKRVVLISPSYFEAEQHSDQISALRDRAAADASADPQALAVYALSYCRRYVTTPANLLSYLDWDRQRLRTALLRAQVPITVIYGSRDDRVDLPWLEDLSKGGVTVRPVAGADHFFGARHEFDLLDEVLQAFPGGKHG